MYIIYSCILKTHGQLNHIIKVKLSSRSHLIICEISVNVIMYRKLKRVKNQKQQIHTTMDDFVVKTQMESPRTYQLIFNWTFCVYIDCRVSIMQTPLMLNVKRDRNVRGNSPFGLALMHLPVTFYYRDAFQNFPTFVIYHVQ